MSSTADLARTIDDLLIKDIENDIWHWIKDDDIKQIVRVGRKSG